MKRKFFLLGLISLIFFILNCQKKADTKQIERNIVMDHYSNEQIDALKGKKIYFGHMSVGYNIFEGVKDICSKESQFSDWNVQEINTAADIDTAGFFHSKNGKNGLPNTKCDAFINFLSQNNIGSQLDIALFKFCYVDIERESNISEIFDYYVKVITEIKQQFPNLKLVHVTVPLCVHSYNIKSKIRNLIYGDIGNVKRNQFNQMLREKYSADDPIFDLALIESSYSDGKRETFRYKDKEYYSLINEYSYDDGHLNEFGRAIVAKELIKLLIGLSSSK